VRRDGFVAWLLCASLLSVSLPSRADPPAPGAPASPSAAELRQRGNDAMSALKPAEALPYYQQAYELSKDPALLYNMGKAHEALEDYPAALAQYERFRREATPELRARVPKLDELVAGVRSKISFVSITSNVVGARVLVRDKAVGQVPAGGPLQLSLAAGPARIEVDADGYAPFKREVELRGGENTAFDAKLVSVAHAGTLVVQSEPTGGSVVVDDKQLGSAPVEQTVDSGAHTIVVRHEGYNDVTTTAVVGVGERKVVPIALEKSAPITQKWWFWTGIGAVVVAGVAVGVTAALLTEKSADKGSIPPGSTSAPLLRF